MENIHFTKWAGSLLLSLVTYLFGGWSDAIACLFYAVILDFISGWIAAGKTGTLQSKIAYLGIQRKVLIFVLIAVGQIIDVVLGDATDDIASALQLGNVLVVSKDHVIRDTIVYFYLFNEILSVIENAGKAGFPIPSFIRKMIDVLKPDKNDTSN